MSAFVSSAAAAALLALRLDLLVAMLLTVVYATSE
jgi:hypothetical protein